MAQTRVVRGTATSIRTEGKTTYIRYHATDVVSFDDATIILNSGGWQTATTRTRMNQAANQFNLPFKVWQKDFAWYVTIAGQTVDFRDGMSFARNQVWKAAR